MTGPLARVAAKLRNVPGQPGVPIAVVLVAVLAVLTPGMWQPRATAVLGSTATEAIVQGEDVEPVPERPADARAERAHEPVPATTADADSAPLGEGEDAVAALDAPDPDADAEAEPEPVDDADRIPLAPVPPGHEVYAGLSTWIDLYDDEWTPEEQVEVASLGGVDAIYVQSARFNSPDDIHDPDRLARVIDAAHDRGIKVMTWYIPDLIDTDKDFRRSVAAMRFTTPRGDRPDGFGLDIELDAVKDVAVRNERLLMLSRSLRDWAGEDYPMAAVVLPPLQLDLNGTWWPDFPYAELRPFYDVYLPMSYSSYRGTDAETTYRWNLENILETRRRAGDPELAVHLAGGIADDLPEVAAFVEAARDGGATGAGLYDLHTTPSAAWPALQLLRLSAGELDGAVPSLVD